MLRFLDWENNSHFETFDFLSGTLMSDLDTFALTPGFIVPISLLIRKKRNL